MNEQRTGRMEKGDGDEGASMEVPSACMCWCALVHVPWCTCPGVRYVCDGAPVCPPLAWLPQGDQWSGTFWLCLHQERLPLTRPAESTAVQSQGSAL